MCMQKVKKYEDMFDTKYHMVKKMTFAKNSDIRVIVLIFKLLNAQQNYYSTYFRFNTNFKIINMRTLSFTT